jgi:hypothetical protein
VDGEAQPDPAAEVVADERTRVDLQFSSSPSIISSWARIERSKSSLIADSP